LVQAFIKKWWVESDFKEPLKLYRRIHWYTLKPVKKFKNVFCGSYRNFLDRGLLMTKKLPNQGLLLTKLKSSLRKYYGRNHDLFNRYGKSVSWRTTDSFHLSLSLHCPFCIADLSLDLQQVYHDGCHLWSRNFFPFLSTWVHPQFIVDSRSSIFSALCSVL
jgi:hypothetical protein